MKQQSRAIEQTFLVGSPDPFFQLLEVDAAHAADFPDAIDQLREGHLTGIVVRGVYSPATMWKVRDRLERHEPPFIKTEFPEKFRSWFYGRNPESARHRSLQLFR